MSAPATSRRPDEELRRLARSSAQTLLELLKLVQSTPLDPEKIRVQADGLEHLAMQWLERHGPLRIGLDAHKLTFNDTLPELDLDSFTVAARYSEQWRHCGVSGLVFLKPIAARELTKILLLPFNPKARGGQDWIRQQIVRNAPEGQVQLMPLLRRAARPAFHTVDGRELLADAVCTLHHGARLPPGAAGQGAAAARLGRLAEELTDFSTQGERLLALVLVEPPCWPQAFRGAQATMLAVLLGQSLELSRPVLAELALSGLQAELGPAAAEDALQDGDRLLGALRFVSHAPRLEPGALHALVAAAEADGNVPSGSRAHIFSRILGVCRAFVGCLRAGVPPHAALDTLLGEPPEDLDVPLIRALGHLLGPVPVGSLVRLAGGIGTGVVCGQWRDRAGRRQPWVIHQGQRQRRIKALLTEPSSGDEGLPRVEAVASDRPGDVGLLLSVLFARS
jgi:hypothetical protein